MNHRITGIKEIVFEDGLINHLQELIQFRESLIICDKNTSAFLPVSARLEKNIRLVTLLENVRPEERIVKQLIVYTKDRELIIALGSGTITDICKYLAYLTKKELVIFPTAPSVNAYTSPTASIIKIGDTQKVSLMAKIPSYIYLDHKILKAAPRRMIASGFYDLICSQTIKVDHLIASVVMNYRYSSEIFEALLPYEEILLKYRKLLINGDSTLIKILMQALNISGLGIWLNGDSRSASQSEHAIAHFLERDYTGCFFHGEMVATGTLFISLLQEKLLKSEQLLKISPEMLSRYKNFKSKYLADIENLTDTFRKINDLRPLLSSMLKRHPYLRQCIVSITKTLPKIPRAFGGELLLKRNFACLDIAYLTRFRINIQ